MRLSRLLWIGALTTLLYLAWRWRRQQEETFSPVRPGAPSPSMPPAPLPGREEPLTPAESDAPSSGPRRIPTRVHRGAPPPVPIGQAPGATGEPPPPEPPADPEPPAVAVALRAAAVGAEAPEEEAQHDTAEVAPTATEPPADAPPEPEAGGALTIEAAALVDINHADHAALVALPGIGPALASRIIAYREQHGPFTSVEQLIEVQGIGPRNLDEFRHLITV